MFHEHGSVQEDHEKDEKDHAQDLDVLELDSEVGEAGFGEFGDVRPDLVVDGAVVAGFGGVDLGLVVDEVEVEVEETHVAEQVV